MIGLEVAAKETIPAFASSDKTASIQFINRLHDAGALTIPSGAQVVRVLPPLNLARAQAEEGLAIIRRVAKELA